MEGFWPLNIWTLTDEKMALFYMQKQLKELEKWERVWIFE